jgi:uncharacterized membrane protein YbhN (UPF0104 family)
MNGFLDALQAFGDRITDVDLRFVAAALVVQVLKTFAVSRAWRNVLTAAYPKAEVPYFRIWGAYLVGVGVNALIPLRGGDAAKVVIAKRQIPDSSYATVASTLVVLLVFDLVAATGFFVWATTIGALPSLSLLHHDAFDLDFLYRHGPLAILVGTAVVLALVLLLNYAWRRVVEFKDHVVLGLSELRSVGHYLHHVAPWQALDWSLRIVTVLFFLRAFGLPTNLHNAALAQITQDLSTALPFSPGGIGTGQALLLYLFRNVASRTGTLAFSVGMQGILVVANAILGIAAMLVLFGSLRLRHLRRKPAAAKA